jgi:dienelactone hydrolase
MNYRIWSGFIIILFLFTGCSSVPKETVTNLTKGQDGYIYFSSPDNVDLTDIIGGKNLKERETTVYGKLLLPRNQRDKIPAVVINHSSGGVKQFRDYRFAKALNKKGIAAFVLYSFKGREGISGHTQSAKSSVTFGMRIADAYTALNLLSTHPAIDSERIAIIGFSSGGSVSLLSADEKVRRRLAKDNLKFAAHVCIYTSALFTYKNLIPTKAPMLFLIGEKDDIAPAKDCLRYAERIKVSGVNVKTVVYPGAHHAWDEPHTQRFSLDHLINSATCHFDILDSGMLQDTTTGYLFPEREWAENSKSCAIKGGTVWRNEKAAKQFVDDTLNFLTEILEVQQ